MKYTPCACRRVVNGLKVTILRCEAHLGVTLVFDRSTGLPEVRSCSLCKGPFIFTDASKNQSFCSRGCAVTEHGGTRIPGYKSYIGMIDRCHNPKNKAWDNYGGRGIIVCEEWRADFWSFIRHIGPRTSPKHSVDRYPDNNGNYEPGNVRWATQEQQNRNMRTNLMVPVGSEFVVATDYAISEGVTRNAIGWRIKHGVPLDKPYLGTGYDLRCFICGHQWKSISGNPRRCSSQKCRTLYWKEGQVNGIVLRQR